ncbi:DUF4214 domain-containing protein [Pseudoduganella sp. LjRoot289]|uniref:DUF4214 domain-containing protein n=1 Tax=Pseudoduganella sp. LjRoot289 TaxID=3342314 RepID=UPI003ECF3BBC
MSLITGNNAIDALVYSSWNAQPGAAQTLTYRFLTDVPDDATAGDAYGFQAMTPLQQQAARAALDGWAAVANLTFVEVGSGGNLRFGTNDQSADNSSGYAYLPQAGTGSVDLYLNNKGYYNSIFTPGSFGPGVLLHEIGHTLGLKHPGNYNSTGGEIDGPFLPAATDNTDYTVMSYNYSSAFNGKYDITPKLYDIQAIQYLYGANMRYHAGDDVYAFNNSQAPLCVWDAGGANTFDFSACTAFTPIDLHAGGFSGTGRTLLNVSIAYNVTISTVLTGSGGSTVHLNDAGDVVKGGTGADVIYVGAGNDAIDAGLGEDTVVFLRQFSDYTVSRVGGGLAITGEGRDLLSGVEVIQFADRSFKASELAPPVAVGGSSGNDLFRAQAGDETIDLGAGLDTVVYAGARTAYTVQSSGKSYSVTDSGASVDLLSGVERLAFDGMNVALDRDGAGGQGYRLYLAALNRSPDLAGLGYWIAVLDNGASLETVAQNFIDSSEFRNTYGTLNSTQFVTQLYSNVLHRAPDAEGLAWHVHHLDTGYSRADVLTFFSESAENQGNVATLVANGIDYTPYLG